MPTMNATPAAAAPAAVPAPKAHSGRFALNLAANLGALGLNILVGAWYVPFLVRHLGPAAYGLIPLASSMTSYMTLITLGLNSAVGRSLTIALEQKDSGQANLIFNTSFWGSLVLCAVLLVPAALGTLFVDHLLRVPPGLVSQARWLFAATTAAFLLNEIKSPFDVSSFCRNRFDLRNLVAISEVLVRVGLVAGLFLAVTPRLGYVGLGIFCGTAVSALGAFWLWRTLTPELSLRLGCFDWGILRSLTHTGGWVIVNQIGAILYLNIDLLVANRLCGAEESGKYAAVLQLPLLMRTLGTAVVAVFSPTVLYYFARKDLSGLTAYLRQAIKCVGLMLALPIGLLCGFAEPLLRLWLGPSFSALSPLLFLMACHLCVNVCVLPLLGLQLATNRVKVPGLVTLLLGACNLGLALLLAGPVGWGLYGIAAAGAIMLTVKNVLFTPAYGAHVLGQRWSSFFPELGVVVVVTGATILLCRAVGSFWVIRGWPELMAAGAAVSLIYGACAYALLLSAAERELIHKLLPWGKSRANARS